jgi:ribosome-associated toxin RatA of RatAB toxin-antitoxin module
VVTPVRPAPAWALAICVLGMALCAAPARADANRELTAAEHAKLARGELVVRPLEQRRGSQELIGGAAWQVIEARPEVVWQALLDTSRYHRFMPRVLEARLVAEKGGLRTVFVRQGTELIDASYYMKVHVVPDKRDISFAVDESRPHDLRTAWGFYSVRPYGNGRTLLAYGIMADIGGGLLTGVLKGTIHEWMLKVPWLLKRFVEGSGRWLYK